jgi:hypothetical protein
MPSQKAVSSGNSNLEVIELHESYGPNDELLKGLLMLAFHSANSSPIAMHTPLYY